MLLYPQTQTPTQVEVHPQRHHELKLTLYGACLKEREDRRNWMQLTAGLIGLKTSFFSSGFLGALS